MLAGSWARPLGRAPGLGPGLRQPMGVCCFSCSKRPEPAAEQGAGPVAFSCYLRVALRLQGCSSSLPSSSLPEDYDECSSDSQGTSHEVPGVHHLPGMFSSSQEGQEMSRDQLLVDVDAPEEGEQDEISSFKHISRSVHRVNRTRPVGSVDSTEVQPLWL